MTKFVLNLYVFKQRNYTFYDLDISNSIIAINSTILKEYFELFYVKIIPTQLHILYTFKNSMAIFF